MKAQSTARDDLALCVKRIESEQCCNVFCLSRGVRRETEGADRCSYHSSGRLHDNQDAVLIVTGDDPHQVTVS